MKKVGNETTASNKTRFRGLFFSLFALTLTGAICGCASYHGRPLIQTGTASSLIEHREAQGFHVAARDLSPSRTSLKHFDRSLKDYGYVPVLVLLELDARSLAAFQVRREDLRLVLRDGTRLEVTDPEKVAAEVSFSHWRTFVSSFLIFPAFFVGSSVNRANELLETDYLEKSLRNVRINPNMRSYQGVVFFHLPKDSAGPTTLEDAYVEVTVYQEGNGDGSVGTRLEFPVHFSVQ